MKVNKGKIFILLASIFTGFLIINSIDLSAVTKNISTLNAVDYKKAVEERNQLYKDIENIKSENIDYRYQISKYDDNDPKKSEKLVEDMKNQLVEYGALSGITGIKGPGLIIKLQDGDKNTLLDTEYEILRKMLHEDDMALVLNDIRNAGAQAIAIDDHRVLPNTGVSCYWAFIGFEDESSTFAPFYIYVIGNPEEMKAALLAENSIIQKLLLRKIKVEIEVKDEIILPATKQNTEAKYMERYESK
ncbi:DUF881 domain-containing protein [Clostridium sp. AL.422]|uniref:DUF881 domain-containing protein n=1 Tax=Clostridium TaxID=1485 RepID=UPI00293DBF2F|nr:MULTISPECIES: DUF881 domain-containing protein [unclassified Clostridium]MDV4152525.1 DUF881 domain-containing protein [Clostridium sp. AL.422]